MRTIGIKSLLLVLLFFCSSSAGPLSERVVLVAEHNGLKKLFICRPDGRDLQRLSKEPGHQMQPAYSPALERFFYVRPILARHQICSVDTRGKDFRLEVDLKAEALYPSVSPDGKKLLFSTDMWGPLELCEMDLDSREIKRLTYDGGINTRAEYSPDGKFVLFLSRRSGLTEVYQIELENDALTKLTESPFAHGAPNWSPDGNRFVATVGRPPKRRSGLFEKDLESGKLRTLVPEQQGLVSPCYSVDGSLILFIDDGVLYTYDPSDSKAALFPLRGRLVPEEAIWVPFPLP